MAAAVVVAVAMLAIPRMCICILIYRYCSMLSFAGPRLRVSQRDAVVVSLVESQWLRQPCALCRIGGKLSLAVRTALR